VTEEADNGGLLSHSACPSLDYSFPSFQEYILVTNKWLNSDRS